MLTLINIMGLIGVGLVLLAYLLLQTHRLVANDAIYSLMNFFGSGFILFSLFFKWNLSAAVVEGSWVLISAYGLFQATKKRKQIVGDQLAQASSAQ